MKKIGVLILIVIFFWPFVSRAAVLKNTYPRLANYFLKWEISDFEARELAKWDLLILDMEVQENSRAQLKKIRELNPRVIILAYVTSQEILNDIDEYNKAYLRQELARGLADGWWLKDGKGNKVSHWPQTSMLNVSDGASFDSRGYRFNDYLPEFIVNKLQATGLWDGVFYDNTWGDVSWVNGGNLDLNNNGTVDSPAEADRLWSAGFKKILAKTRALAGADFMIVGNGRVYGDYQSIINGMMLEDFPSTWENGGTWSGSMQTYLRLPSLNASPSLPIINVFNKSQTDYQRLRYGLASALLGDGFYSFDYDISDHSRLWWYDEYDVNLGFAQAPAYNLLSATAEIKPGLWRRDFKNGVAIVNSTDKKQTYSFQKEEFEKIKGKQDSIFNNGQRINYLQLAPREGIVLFKSNNLVENSAFANGYFYRVFNLQGVQMRNGFFSYVKSFPGEAETLIAASGSEEIDNRISAAAGQVNLYRNGRSVAAFNPYDKLFKGQLSLASEIKNGYFETLIVGTGPGGGPQVRIFTPAGKLLGGFFAYDKNSRGGVNVAFADVNGDGQAEIITGPGKGEEPLVKIFSTAGKLKASFLAYDSKFRGGVDVAAGDVNGDGQAEIITGPVGSGGPQVRIFTGAGQTLGSFFAYDRTFNGGIKVSVSDVNGDGRAEILVGLKNFY
ncbi:MAG: putative glycoside hydrolase [Patescibacteria group bacterium]